MGCPQGKAKVVAKVAKVAKAAKVAKVAKVARASPGRATRKYCNRKW